MKTINTAQVRSMNQHSVRRQLLSLHSATKAQLASATGLSPMTVGTLIAQMQQAGEVYEQEAVPSGGGRPSALYAYEKDFALMMIVFGYQKDNNNFICVRIKNLFGEVVASCESFVEDVTLERLEELMEQALTAGQAGAGLEEPAPGAPVTIAEQAVRGAKANGQLMGQKIRVIGFGLPGVERDGRIVSNDYASLVGIDLIDHFRQRYHAEVRFINDINSVVYGYYDRVKPLAACKTMELSPAVVGIYYPRLYYPGAGIIIDGKIYLGSQNFAGEVCRLPYVGPVAQAAVTRPVSQNSVAARPVDTEPECAQTNGSPAAACQFAEKPLPADWLAIDYGDREQVCACIAGHLSQICSVLAPERVALYGDFFAPEDAGRIGQLTEQLLEGRFHVQLDIVADLADDFERGLSVLMGDLMYRTVFGGEEF